MRLVKLKAMKRINGLHFTPDGRRLLVVGGVEAGSADEAVWIDPTTGAESGRMGLNAERYAVSADLKWIALGSATPDEDSEEDPIPIAVCNMTDSDGLRTIVAAGPTATEVYGLAFDPTGERLAASYTVANRSGYHTAFRLAVFPLGRGKPIEVLDRDSDEFTASVFAFSPDGKTLACDGGKEDRAAVKVRDAKTLAPLRTFFPKGSQTHHLVFSPDGGTLAVAHAKAVYLLPSDSDVPRFTLIHPKQANAVAFTPDGGRILSACHDGSLRIWDVATGQLVTSYDWGIGQTTAVVVSPDGLTAAVAGQKGQIAVFDLD